MGGVKTSKKRVKVKLLPSNFPDSFSDSHAAIPIKANETGDTLILPIIGTTGAGKTLWCVCYAYAVSIICPDIIITANFKGNLPNWNYSPYLIMPFSELEGRDNLVILDDIKTLKNIQGFITFLASASRKCDTHVLITGQYYTQIPPEVRGFATHDISYTYFHRDIDVIELEAHPKDKQTEYFYFEDAIKTCGGLYDTRQINNFPDDLSLERELIKKSPTLEDLSKNLMLVYGNRATRRSVFNKLKKEHY